MQPLNYRKKRNSIKLSNNYMRVVESDEGYSSYLQCNSVSSRS